jgi:hypothetical protein
VHSLAMRAHQQSHGEVHRLITQLNKNVEGPASATSDRALHHVATEPQSHGTAKPRNRKATEPRNHGATGPRIAMYRS